MKLRTDKRRQRQRKGKVASLNLVSLMDIFTILVFFLMVNSSEVEVLQTSSDIKLPDSTSEQRPKNQITISVSAEDLIVQGRPVAKIEEISGDLEPLIAGLKTELEYQAERRGEIPEGGHKITVMGDKEVPYWLLKRILYTCQTSDFAQVSLAVNKVGGAKTAEELMAETNSSPAGAAS
ncbi:MAG: biopolymer transporter ExbD [Pseudomonadales bacterium]|nr:biopolymer transporter ExbD [Pseudomonadales bacterium]